MNLAMISKDTLNKAHVSKRFEYKRTRKLAYSTVGTPDYIAPEVFGNQGYTEIVDWWSVGAIMFEMMVGYPPFFAEDPSVICNKILHWKTTLKIPPEANLSKAATSLIHGLMCDQDDRLGKNGIDEIKNHPFFKGIDWDKLMQYTSPFNPEVKTEIDCSRFEKYKEDEPWYPPQNANGSNKSGYRKNRKDINFVGYTFKRDVEEQK